jgi:HEAT repeat protein
MDARASLQIDLESLIAFAADRRRDDDEVFDRLSALVRASPAAALEAGEELLHSDDPDRREIGADIIGAAAEMDYSLRERALPPLRRVLAEDSEPGPISAAIVKLGNKDDIESHDPIVAFARHPDALVRHAVAVSLPAVGLDEAALAALRELSRDEDEDVRDWATFGLGCQYAGDDPETREALFARVEDPHYDTRCEAIWGLAFRHDERVRPYLLRELEDPDASDLIHEAAEILRIANA